MSLFDALIIYLMNIFFCCFAQRWSSYYGSSTTVGEIHWVSAFLEAIPQSWGSFPDQACFFRNAAHDIATTEPDVSCVDVNGSILPGCPPAAGLTARCGCVAADKATTDGALHT